MLNEIKKRFEENLQLTQEENPTMPLVSQIAIAQDLTIEDATRYIIRVAVQLLASHQDAVNATFYS